MVDATKTSTLHTSTLQKSSTLLINLDAASTLQILDAASTLQNRFLTLLLAKKCIMGPEYIQNILKVRVTAYTL